MTPSPTPTPIPAAVPALSYDLRKKQWLMRMLWTRYYWRWKACVSQAEGYDGVPVTGSEATNSRLEGAGARKISSVAFVRIGVLEPGINCNGARGRCYCRRLRQDELGRLQQVSMIKALLQAEKDKLTALMSASKVPSVQPAA